VVSHAGTRLLADRIHDAHVLVCHCEKEQAAPTFKADVWLAITRIQSARFGLLRCLRRSP
jgi:hypothetical protein